MDDILMKDTLKNKFVFKKEQKYIINLFFKKMKKKI